nr:D-glycero-beta-D-manno-heptose 1,7-bisphosphate 7-phosphatase [Limnohabitans sp. Rim8]
MQRIRQPQGSNWPPTRQAAFLDRDGVINQDKGYVHRWEDFEFLPGAIEGMRLLQDAGYALVVVTNQSGLARGHFTEQAYQALMRAMREALEREGVQLAGVYHCPHHPSGAVSGLAIECDCRKPAPGLLLQAARELNLSLTDSVLIGDKPSDIAAARAAGVGLACLVHSDNPESAAGHPLADGHFDSLLDCAKQLLLQRKQQKMAG